MKLAEALLLRSDIQKKIASLQARCQKYAIVQEGEVPAEDPVYLLRQHEAVSLELMGLVVAINQANLQNAIQGGQTLTEALAQRDSLTLRHRALQGVIDACAKPPDRYGIKEIRWVVTLKIASLQAQADDLAKANPRVECRHPGGGLEGRVEKINEPGKLRASVSQRKGILPHRVRGGQRRGFDPLMAQLSPASGTAHDASRMMHYLTR
jgi:hypothetical protein